MHFLSPSRSPRPSQTRVAQRRPYSRRKTHRAQRRSLPRRFLSDFPRAELGGARRVPWVRQGTVRAPQTAAPQVPLILPRRACTKKRFLASVGEIPVADLLFMGASQCDRGCNGSRMSATLGRQRLLELTLSTAERLPLLLGAMPHQPWLGWPTSRRRTRTASRAHRQLCRATRLMRSESPQPLQQSHLQIGRAHV